MHVKQATGSAPQLVQIQLCLVVKEIFVSLSGGYVCEKNFENPQQTKPWPPA